MSMELALEEELNIIQKRKFSVIQIKRFGVYKDIAKDVVKRYDTYYYKDQRRYYPLPTGRNKVIALMKERIGGKTITKFIEIDC